MVEHLLSQLPESHSAQRLFAHLSDNPLVARVFEREPGLLSDVLALAAWSPLLAATLEQNPEYVTWLQRERVNIRVRTHEELSESLGRFSLTNSTLDPHIMLSRFRRRELLRTYLHDIRHTRGMAETTEELSNLADTVLEFALNRARPPSPSCPLLRKEKPDRYPTHNSALGNQACPGPSRKTQRSTPDHEHR